MQESPYAAVLPEKHPLGLYIIAGRFESILLQLGQKKGNFKLHLCPWLHADAYLEVLDIDTVYHLKHTTSEILMNWS